MRASTRALASLGAIDSVVLDGTPHPDIATVERVRAARRRCPTRWSRWDPERSTISRKYAAATDGKPYVVFATAPSMNGYTSMNAAITVAGHKKTLPAAGAARRVHRPRRLCRGPAADDPVGARRFPCRSTAQADWLLSRHLRGTPYRDAPFALLAADEAALLDAPEALLGGDLDAMRVLARTLVLSGLGMTICGGSYPASQGEHLISHYIDMFAPAGRAEYFHGEQVGCRDAHDGANPGSDARRPVRRASPRNR